MVVRYIEDRSPWRAACKKENNGISQYKKILPVRISPVEIVVIVAVPDELLFPVLAGIERGPEIPYLGCLEGRTERAEGSINIVCLCPDRAITDTFDDRYCITAGKWHPDRMARQTLDEHAERGKQEF